MVKKTDVRIDREQFGRELKDLIFSKGYKSIYDFHKQCDEHQISYSSLKHTVSGSFEASISNLLHMADALKMSPKQFFNSFSFKRQG